MNRGRAGLGDERVAEAVIVELANAACEVVGFDRRIAPQATSFDELVDVALMNPGATVASRPILIVF
jgi:hypothetical protein